MLLGSKGLGHYWRTHYADKTFEHLYRWNLFDVCLLVPYFVVMLILAFYGIHRYQLVWLYYRNRKNAAKWSEPVARFEEGKLPFVTIQLPIFNEQFVIDRLIEACCRLNYPRDRFEIQVLDDSTDETVIVAKQIVKRYAAGFAGMEPQPIRYLHRTNRHGYKAGALDKGLDVAKGDLIAIFDADFVPPPEWVMQVVHHFAEPGIGMVQTRWTHLNRNYSFLTQVEGILLDGHFVLEHGGRSRAGVFFNFNGTAGMWRRGNDLGGWRVAARHADRGHRPELPGADGGVEVQVPAGCGVPGGAADRDDGVQDAAGAMGERVDPDRQEDPAEGAEERRAVPHKAGGLVSPDGEHQLPADDYPEHAADAGDDYPKLARNDADAADRPSAVYGEHDVDLVVLPGEPEGTASEDVVEDVPLHPVLDGAGGGADDHEYEGSAGGAARGEERVCADPEIPGEQEGREIASEGLSEALRDRPMDRTGDRVLLYGDGLVCNLERKLFYCAFPGALRVWVLVHGTSKPAAGAI